MHESAHTARPRVHDPAVIDAIAAARKAAFERFSSPLVEDAIKALPYNYCPECRVPMALTSSEYLCSCGIAVDNSIENGKDANATAAAIRISSGSNSGKFYNVVGDYSKTQHKAIMKQLLSCHMHYKGTTAFPRNVINATAASYNNIQRTITEEMTLPDGTTVTKKFVKRGTIKCEILAALMFYECVRVGLVRKKKDIAMFMDLETYGFSRGETILRNLAAEGRIDLPLNDDEVASRFVDKYAEALNIVDQGHIDFVTELVELSEERRICMRSHLSSKVAGAMWVLIRHARLDITETELERAADNTKRHTFMRFYEAVFSNMTVFGPLFREYGVSQ